MPQRPSPLRFARSGLRTLSPSSTLAINDRVREMWAEGSEVLHLAFGESRFPVQPALERALAALREDDGAALRTQRREKFLEMGQKSLA